MGRNRKYYLRLESERKGVQVISQILIKPRKISLLIKKGKIFLSLTRRTSLEKLLEIINAQ